MKITVIDNCGDIVTDIRSIEVYVDMVVARVDDLEATLYCGKNVDAVMNHIRSVLLAADYSGRESILINLNDFDGRMESNILADDSIKHGDLIKFNGREAYVIDLKNELNPTEDFPLFVDDDGVLILDKPTLKPIDMYSGIEHLNRDYKEYKTNEIIKL
ncbi:MAG: hypothetical protein ACTTKY_00250 [Catonella sp.]